MKIEIHWPEGFELLDTAHTDVGEDSIVLANLISLSYKHDVIIDCGKITFVDKE